jgi:hypothetical protein
MDQAALTEYREALDTRVRGGRATLEDFGTLARVHEELTRRSGAVVSAVDAGT